LIQIAPTIKFARKVAALRGYWEKFAKKIATAKKKNFA